jgi:hypothetical protein
MIAIAINYKEIVMSKIVTRSELQARLGANPGLVLLEALPEKYYNDWHLPGARHFPHDSHIAANVLQQIGYSNVAVYAGGKEDWKEEVTVSSLRV